MKNKRFIVGLLLFTLTFMLALAGCGKSDSASSSSPSASVAPSASAASPASAAPSDSPSASPSAAPAESPSPSAPAADGKVQLIVSAAASLTESLNEIKPIYEAAHPGVTLAFNFGASGTLQKQIEQGAKADLFLSAGSKQMTALVDEKFVDPATEKNLLLNELVVVVPAKGGAAVTGLADLKKPEFKKIAVGTPETVPAGSYAQQALTSAKLWDELKPKMVFANDVKQVLNYVETGNTEVGFVYKTDALASKAAKIAYAVDKSAHKPITYPIGIIQATEHRAEAEALYHYLISKDAVDIFLKHGFLAAQ